MVRVLASLIVVCLVVATGVRSVVAAPAQRSTLTVARASEPLHARAVEAAAHGRVVSRASGAGPVSRTSGAAPELPAIVGAGGLAMVPRAACSTGPAARAPLIVVSRPISTCSARGPPVV